MINKTLIKKIKSIGEARFPNEACGFVVSTGANKKATIVECRNDALYPKTQFIINSDEYLRVSEMGEIIGIWHTHTNGNTKPSESDLYGCEATNLPWYLISVEQAEDGFKHSDLISFTPNGYEAPYVGRPYVFGSFDCWTLCKDFYKREFGIQLKDYPRIENFWTKDESNYFITKTDECDLIDVTGQPIQYGDIVFIQTDSSGNPSHSAIYVGDEQILHHCIGRLSKHDMYVHGSYWLKHTVKQVRHKNNVS